MDENERRVVRNIIASNEANAARRRCIIGRVVEKAGGQTWLVKCFRV